MTSPPLAPQEALSQKLGKEFEKEVFQKDRPLYTRVEDWILEQERTDRIKFELWGTTGIADADLNKILAKDEFSEFKTFYESAVGKIGSEDPEKKKEFIKLFQEKLQKQFDTRREKRKARAEFAEKHEGSWIENTVKQNVDRLDGWIGDVFDENKSKSEKIISAAKTLGVAWLMYQVVTRGYKYTTGIVKKGTGGKGFLWPAATIGALGYGAYSILGPKSANDSERKWHEKLPLIGEDKIDPPSVENAGEFSRLEEIIGTSEGAKAAMGLLHTPVKDIIEEYKNKSDEQVLNPDFLLKNLDKKVKNKEERELIKKMIKKINPSVLFKLVSITITAFEHSPKYQAMKKTEGNDFSVIKFLGKEYVVGYTEIEFPQLLEDALEIMEKKL